MLDRDALLIRATTRAKQSAILRTRPTWSVWEVQAFGRVVIATFHDHRAAVRAMREIPSEWPLYMARSDYRGVGYRAPQKVTA